MPRALPESVLLAPLPLRLVLALTFIWAGWGKFEATMPVKGDAAARLANMGVIVPAAPPAAPAQPTPPTPLPSPSAAGDAAPVSITLTQLPGSTSRPGGLQYTAADFPDEISVKRLWGIALRVSVAGNPRPNATGAATQRVWPEFLSDGVMARLQAQAVMIVEILGGAFVLVGFMTRLSSLALAFVMLGAMWLDQIGPALQSGSTAMGFLPNHDRWDVRAWTPMLWQACLLAGSVTLALLGGGRLSVDRMLAASRTIVVVRPPATPVSSVQAATPSVKATASPGLSPSGGRA